MAKKEIKSTLGDYFDESVPSAIKRTITDNAPFRITENGKTLYVCMLLDAAKIGGINKKSQNNAQIGGMIECVKGSKIDLFVTADTIEKGELLFIPTPTTFDGLSDFGLFTGCGDYEFVKLNNNLEIVERTGIFGTYTDFREISAGHALITDFITPPASETETSDGAKNDGQKIASQVSDKVKSAATAIADKASSIVQSVAEKVADNTGYRDMTGGKGPVEAAPPTAVPANGSPAASQQATVDSASQTASAENVVEEDIVYDEETVRTAVVRTFHADNLDLPVSSEPFDQLFTLNNHLIKFDVDPRDTYVNEHLNKMAADANRDLKKLRADNLHKLREKYFMLMSLRVIEIQKELDVNNQDTEYGSQKWALEATRKDSLSNVDEKIEAKRKSLEDDYTARRDAFCNAAASAAKNDFNARYQRSHDDEMNRVEGAVKSEIQSDYDRDLQTLYTARRNEAFTLLDLNITEVLTDLADDYKKMFNEENAFYTKCADEMRAYAKELHAEDAQRLAIEEERNRISNEVNDARAEAAAKIDLIKKEYESARNAADANSNALIEQARTQNNMLKEQMSERTTALEKDKDKLQQQLDETIDKATRLQETIKADYEHRIMQAEDDRDSWKQTFDSYKEQHKHNNRITAVLVIAITIAALAGGFVAGGVYWNRTVAGELTDNKMPTVINVIEPTKTNSTDEATTEVTVESSDSMETESESVSSINNNSSLNEG